MQKLGLYQSMQQKLSPQQIQFIKLLQVPTVELEARIEEEMEINPALEEGTDDKDDYEDEENESESKEEEINFEEYLAHDDIGGYKMANSMGGDEEERDMPIESQQTFLESLVDQINFLKLDERKKIIANQLVGSIESDGYIRRDLDAMVNDLAFSQNLETDLDEIEEVLYKIQTFEPAGIGARSLQECLMLQLERRDLEDEKLLLAYNLLDVCFEEFTKKHFDKILKKLSIEEDQLKAAIAVITRLNPKPGSSQGTSARAQYVIPDFILTNDDDDKFHLALNARNAPDLKVSRSYTEMMKTYNDTKEKDKKMKEAVTFVKQKLDSAKWFIDAIKQRQQTLLRTMHSILRHQHEFFMTGDEATLRPMILKDIAEDIEMDISTISRVANSKAIQTEFGVFPLKYFFSESLSTDSGEDVSSKEVKAKLRDLIEKEEKKKPLSDDKLEKELKAMGYNIARRTVAKYREQMDIPVARLRKQL